MPNTPRSAGLIKKKNKFFNVVIRSCIYFWNIENQNQQEI